MKTKLFITIVAVISAVAVASAVTGSGNDASANAVPENSYCEIVPVHEWPEYLC